MTAFLAQGINIVTVSASISSSVAFTATAISTIRNLPLKL
jgi:hypothetical protein